MQEPNPHPTPADDESTSGPSTDLDTVLRAGVSIMILPDDMSFPKDGVLYATQSAARVALNEVATRIRENNSPFR